MPLFKRLITFAATVVGCASLASASTIFDLNTITDGTVAPFSSTVSGLTASFTGSSLAACNITSLNFAFQSGIAAITALCNTSGTSFNSMGIGFSQPLSSISFDFATSSPDTLVLSAFLGASPAGGTSGTGGVINVFPEGVIGFNGLFDSVVLTTTVAAISVDNINATASVPEPASVFSVVAGLALVLIRRDKRSAGIGVESVPAD